MPDMREVSIFLLLALANFPSLAEIYKWTDANGKVHYSDKGVGNGAPIRIQKSVAEDQEAKTKLQQFRNQLESKKLIDEKQAEEAQKLASERETKCRQIRDRLQGFEEFGQIVQVKDGERQYLDHHQKDTEMAEMKQFLKDNCE